MAKTKSPATILTKTMITRIFTESHSRLKRPILHHLFNTCKLFGDLNNVSQASARKSFCEFFQIEISIMKYHMMQKSFELKQIEKFNFTIEQKVITDFENKYLK